MVCVEDKVLSGMIEHARRERPLESCGLLTRRGDVIDGIRHCTNELRSPTRFSIPATELLSFFRELRDASLEFAGIYHSHPGGPAVPSATDVENFHYPGVSYWIVSLAGSEPVVGCFDWAGTGFAQQPYQVERSRES